MLPVFHTSDKDLQLMQNSWSKQLNPVLALPQSDSLILDSIELKAGVNIINHLLARKMIGWSIIDQDSASTIYRSAPLNAQTLTLTSSAPTTIKLQVF